MKLFPDFSPLPPAQLPNVKVYYRMFGSDFWAELVDYEEVVEHLIAGGVRVC